MDKLKGLKKSNVNVNIEPGHLRAYIFQNLKLVISTIFSRRGTIIKFYALTGAEFLSRKVSVLLVVKLHMSILVIIFSSSQ